jgi:hypothetical protein
MRPSRNRQRSSTWRGDGPFRSAVEAPVVDDFGFPVDSSVAQGVDWLTDS